MLCCADNVRLTLFSKEMVENRTTDGTMRYSVHNPSPAESGYVLPLQTV